MTAITAATVKELREKTGAGMMDCKKALTESNGDFEGATAGFTVLGNHIRSAFETNEGDASGRGASA